MKSLLQTQEWATLRQAQGWQAHWVDEILVLEKKLAFGLSFLYAPEVDFYQINFASRIDPSSQLRAEPSSFLRMTSFLQKVCQIAKNARAIFIRFDFLNKIDQIYGQKIIKILKDFRFIESFEEIQPEWRQIIDISRSEEQILAQMKPKGRYNIKIAQKHGVKIEKSDNIEDFYKLFRQTAQRDHFETRPKKYFEDLLKILAEKDLAELLVARYNDKTIAAEIITFYDETASYLYGASSSEHREIMAPYLLHWEAIKLAKEKGCKVYDLLAIAPPGEASHKHAGITRFKEQFGGQKVHLVGSWDLVLKPVWYAMFKIAEKMRRK